MQIKIFRTWDDDEQTSEYLADGRSFHLLNLQTYISGQMLALVKDDEIGGSYLIYPLVQVGDDPNALLLKGVGSYYSDRASAEIHWEHAVANPPASLFA